MWTSQLRTFNTSTSSASIKFDFTNPTDKNGPTYYAGVSVIEVVVIYNCPAKYYLLELLVQVLLVCIGFSDSCELLVRACSDEFFTFAKVN